MGKDLELKHATYAFIALVIAWILAVIFLARAACADSTGMFPFIRVDGQSTTTAPIPFAEGIRLAAGDINDLSLSAIGQEVGIYFPSSTQMKFAGRGTSGSMLDIMEFVMSAGFSTINVNAAFLRPAVGWDSDLGTNGQPWGGVKAQYVSLIPESALNPSTHISLSYWGGNNFQIRSDTSNRLRITTTSGAFTQTYLWINNTDASVEINTAPAGGTTTIGRATASLILPGNVSLTSLTGPGILNINASEVIGVASSSDILTAIGTIDISSNTNLAVASPITLTGDTVGFDWSQTGTVMLKTDAGATTFYKPSADTDAARGTALESAIAAHAAGDVIVVGPGDYELTGSFALLEGASLIGQGRPLLYADKLSNALIRLINDDVTVEGIDVITDAVGFGELSATPISVSGIVLRDVSHTPSAASNTSGLQFTEVIGGGTTEHTVQIDVWDSKFYGGSTLGYGVHMNLDDGSVVNLWNCDVYGATDGILNKTTSGTSTGVTNIYGGTYRSVLDAITSGGGTSNVINVYGATAYGDQADIYGDDGTVNLYWADYRTDYAVGNGINTTKTDNVMGNLNVIAGQLTYTAYGGATDAGLRRISTSTLQVTNGASTRGDLEVADLAYNATTWNGSFEVPTKNAVRDQIELLQPLDATLTALAAYNTNGLLTQTAADTFTGRTITGTTNQVNVANGNGVSGNPTLSLPQDVHTAATPTFGQLTLSSTSPIITLTDTSASEDDFTLSTVSGGFQLVNITDSVTAFSVGGTGVNTYNVSTGNAHIFNVNNAEELRIAANRLTTNNGSSDMYLDWSTNGRLDVGGGPLFANASAIIGESGMTPYGTSYALSVQSPNSFTYIEILNSGGSGLGAFFGMNTVSATNHVFELWNYQGVSEVSGDYPIVFYGGYASVELARFDRANGNAFNDQSEDIDFRVEGDTLGAAIYLDASSATENIALVAVNPPNWQSMDRGLFIGNATTVPTGNPTSGGFLYVESGALKYRGSSGTITTLGPA